MQISHRHKCFPLKQNDCHICLNFKEHIGMRCYGGLIDLVYIWVNLISMQQILIVMFMEWCHKTLQPFTFGLKAKTSDSSQFNWICEAWRNTKLTMFGIIMDLSCANVHCSNCHMHTQSHFFGWAQHAWCFWNLKSVIFFGNSMRIMFWGRISHYLCTWNIAADLSPLWTVSDLLNCCNLSSRHSSQIICLESIQRKIENGLKRA